MRKQTVSTAPMTADAWRLRQLTFGTPAFAYHAHSYYDIPVFDVDSRRIATHRMNFAERVPAASDEIVVGYIDCETAAGFQPIGTSVAWSWQQGPMAQWRPGTRTLHWNDRVGGDFITRLYDLDTDQQTDLPAPTYAITPDGRHILSLNMARLETLRPGYGYAGGQGANLATRAPSDDGVWRVATDHDESRLVLSIADGVSVLERTLSSSALKTHRRSQYHYWFNHAKISPDGRRFTVKLRYKTLDGSWNDSQGVSLTCGIDGEDPRVLVSETSHVIWRDDEHLYLWRRDGFYLYRDTQPSGQYVRELGAGLVEANAHLRYLPGYENCFVFDTPYRDTVNLYLHDDRSAETLRVAQFTGHRPRNGQFRCDVHPAPSPDGRRIALTSVADGGRQVYVLEQTATVST